MLRFALHVARTLAHRRNAMGVLGLVGLFLLGLGTAPDARAQVKGAQIDKEELRQEHSPAEVRAKARQSQPELSVLDANNLPMWLRRNGQFDFVDPFTGGNGSFPKGATPKTTFAQGLLWGGQVSDGTDRETIRVNGSTYGTGLAPGGLNSDGTPEDAANQERFHVWRVHRDYTDPTVLREAAAYVDGVAPSAVSQSRLQEVRDQYEYDWNNWPAGDGAPYEECNGQAGYQPADPAAVASGTSCANLNGDIPGRPDAEQTIWIVTNDIGSRSSEDASLGSYGSPAIGMEVQFTLWSYERPAADPLGNANFIQGRLIYKGLPDASSDARIDSMFVSWWADPDIGSNFNDFAGVDTSRSLGFAYNGTASDAAFDAEGLPPAAAGWDVLQAPSTAGEEEKLNAFPVFASGGEIVGPRRGVYDGSLQWYNLMRGFKPRPAYPDGDPFVNPLTGEETKFVYPGDPVSGNGWVDGNPGPGDRRIANSAGPFTMQRGDTVDVVVGKMAAVGQDRLGSLTKLRSYDDVVEYATDAPVSTPTDLSAQAPDTNSVELNWAGIEDSDLDQYEIYRSTEPIAGRLTDLSPIATVNASTTSYTDEAKMLEAFQTYHYRVRAVNGSSEESIFSNEATATPAPLPAPEGLTAFVSNANEVEVSWEPVQDDSLDEYRVYRDTASIDGAPADLAPLATVDSANTTYVEEPDSAGTYYYRVTAAGASGDESTFSNEGEAAAGPVPPPTGLTIGVSDGGVVDLNWPTVDDTDVSGYRIYRGFEPIERPGDREALAEADASATNYVDEPDRGANYYYAVTAVGPDGGESFAARGVAPVPLQIDQSDLAVVADYENGQRDTSASGGTTIQGTGLEAPSSNGAFALEVDASGSGAVTFDRRANLPDSDRLSFLLQPDPSTNFTLTLTFVEEANGSEASYDVTIPVDSGKTWRRYEVPFSDVGSSFDPVASRSGGNGPFLRLQASANKDVTYLIDELEFGTKTRALVNLEDFERPQLTTEDFGFSFSDTDAVANPSDGFTTRSFPGGLAAYDHRFLTLDASETHVLSFRAKANTSGSLSFYIETVNGEGGFTSQSGSEVEVSESWQKFEVPLTDLGDDVSVLREAGLQRVIFQGASVSEFTLDDVKILRPEGEFVAAEDSAYVDTNGKTSFSGTGLTIDFTGISGEGEVTVRQYIDAPSNPTGLDEESVITRHTVESGNGLEIGADTKVQFDAGEFGISNPDNVVVYKRSTPGQGVFNGLETTYDREAGELVASVESFGEFALAPASDSVTVWAGDTDNDGTVDQEDVLPLGMYWDQSGPARAETGCTWGGDSAAPWSPEAATYADANGDGTVDQEDVLCLGLNWGETRSTSSAPVIAEKSQTGEAAGRLKLRRAEQSGSTVWVELYAREVESLMGVAAELTFDSEAVSVESVEPGARMGESALLQSNTDEANGTLGLGVSRKGIASKSGGGPVARVKLRSETDQPEIGLREGRGSTAEGATVSLKTSEGGLETLPEKVTLEPPAPNPVQDRTTIEYALPEAQKVRLTMYDVLGREVAVLVHEKQKAGRKQVRVDASEWSSGTYFYRLEAGDAMKTDRLTVVR